ncbi:hypothetical protein NNJEOMEG_00100 [Fundidesulfovibrio magnetotacticus]|uniref:TIGR03067 domain-containing protein n=1 Tax=Fundidesulfovibrio magnetotacticus TaxID=2730080 RepID=A0A6V8LPM1_9BACT|nr:hypothetical protein [Fundidesulfovibrio magnetotacticus]GFK92278.1 hypothetical protein NNJEOMEG_00100 [Fundidesulfovibrio magnetotacticus]
MRLLATAALFALLLAAPALAQQPGPIPNLVGTWEAGPFELHHKSHGFIMNKGQSAKLVVTAQEGRVFHGSVEWGNKAPGKDTFSGVIDKDNVTFYLAGHEEGLRLGKLDGPDAFTFYYLVPGGKNPRAGFVEYKRKK